MQRWTAQAVAALAALAIGLIAPALAEGGVTRHYYTELYRFPQGGFPTSGTLDLTIRDDGSITGYYRPTDGGIGPVNGHLAGSRISLDIGGAGDALHVNGMLDGGKISGRAFRTFGRQEYTFRGLPIPNDQTLPRVTPVPWPDSLV
ncbi:MAG TPA: hypothetical protein VIN40_10845 [Candidatus Tyrphobacter sp.]